MPTISHRGEVMPASPIRKLVPLANKAKEKGIKVFHLNIGQPDLPTPQIGLDALRHMHRRILEYSPSEGIKSLREKLVQYYDKFHIHVTADDIIITTGGSEAVLFSFMACLDPGDEIIELSAGIQRHQRAFGATLPAVLPAAGTNLAPHGLFVIAAPRTTPFPEFPA